MKRLVTAAFIFSLLTTLGVGTAPQADALSGSSFKAGRIIDDALFFNGNAVGTNDVQAFLNAKVPVCDTNGSQPYGGTTRAAYGTSRGYPPPYTCLKDYRQDTWSIPADAYCNGFTPGNKSAAQIIHEVGVSCGVSQKAILITLQKEQSFITDDWPWPTQYTKATGFGCPDSALPTSVDANQNGCYDEYEGFFKQVYYGARQFKRYAQDTHIFTSYRAYRTSFIQYNPNSNCGGTNVYVENQATAGLYVYTPYQPNQAALNNLYGTGDGCSAYGNRNFWRMYNDWFGPPINDAYAWEVVQETASGKIYLNVNHTKYWIPGPSILNAWGLEDIPARQVDSTYLANFATGPNMNYVGLDINGNRFLMNGGKKYFLSSDAYVLVWGLAGVPHISAPGYVAQVASGGNAGRFVKTESGPTYLLDGVNKHAGVNTNSLPSWGQTTANTTVATSDVVDRLPNGAAVDHLVSNGGKRYVVDQGQALQFPNANIEDAWVNSTPAAVNIYSLNFLPKKNVGTFVLRSGESQWQYIENGRRHPVLNPSLAIMWGWGNSNPLTVVSTDLYNDFTAAAALTYLATSDDDGKQYIINRAKHWLTSPTYATVWGGTTTPTAVSSQALNTLPNGPSIATINVGFNGHPSLYALSDGKLHGISSTNSLSGLGGSTTNKFITVDDTLRGQLTKGPILELFLRNSTTNTTYYLDSGKKYAIDDQSLDTWGASTAPPFSSSSLSTITDSGLTLKEAVSFGARKYLINNKAILDVTNDFNDYGILSSDFVNVENVNLPKNQSSSHLVSTPSNGKIWLLSGGKRFYITTPALLTDLGYGTHSTITNLSADIVSNAPEQAAKATRLVKSPNSGILFVINGKGYGFKDSATLIDYIGTGSVQEISELAFNKFGFSGWTSQVITGTDGKVYAVENGQKGWVTSPAVLNSRYPGASIWFIPQSVVNEFPSGPNITN
jgi:hypothetical protein